MESREIFRARLMRNAEEAEGALDADGKKYFVVPFQHCRDVAHEMELTWRDAEIAALSLGICPTRYERNMGTIGLDGQAKLLRATVAVVGLGGLGGLLVDLLARAGVGHMVLIDGDDFSENNLNRQLLCTEADLGRGKAEAAFAHATAINDALDVEVIALYIESDEDAEYFLSSADLVIDALDNNATRKIVSRYCNKKGIPMVHGAIGGLWAQAGVFRPGDKTPWDSDDVPDKGAEQLTGNPPFTAAFTAAYQAMLAIGTITEKWDVRGGALQWFDLGEGVGMRI